MGRRAATPLKRRILVALLGVVALTSSTRTSAQPTGSDLPLLAVLWPGSVEVEVSFDAAMRRGLKDGGFVEGRNFRLATRHANGDFQRLRTLAGELVALSPRVIITAPDPAVMAVHSVAPTTPLVMTGFVGDPIALGLAKSYSRPEGSVTGLMENAGGGEESLVEKRLSFLGEVAPGFKHLGLIVGANTPIGIATQNGAAAASRIFDFQVDTFPVRTLDDVQDAFETGIRLGVDAFYVDGDPLLFTNAAKVAELAARAGKPTVGQIYEQARAGLLMAYSVDLSDGWRRAGGYAAKILAGAKPSDLPIEQAMRFTLVINSKTAKALGLDLSPTLLSLADEVIE